MSKTNGYSRLQIGLHWLVAALIVTNYFVSEGMEDAFDGMLEGTAASGLAPVVHVWAGVAVLVLVVLRLLVRMVQGAPEATGASVADKTAVWGHRVLYALMLAVPVLGAITWFGGIEATADPHVLAVNALMILALGHAGMAIFHQFVLRDGLLARMMRAR